MALAPDSTPTPVTTRAEPKALPIGGSVAYITVQSRALDSAAMLALHEWLNRQRFRLFGGLRSSDQQDAAAETFIRTLEFADRMRNPGALLAIRRLRALDRKYCSGSTSTGRHRRRSGSRCS
jgi:hypothetical protein